MRASMSKVWCAAAKRESADIPECPEGITLPGWLSLILEKYCRVGPSTSSYPLCLILSPFSYAAQMVSVKSCGNSRREHAKIVYLNLPCTSSP